MALKLRIQKDAIKLILSAAMNHRRYSNIYKDDFVTDDVERNMADTVNSDKRFVYDADLREIFFNSYEKTLLTDGQGKILLMNPVAEAHWGSC